MRVAECRNFNDFTGLMMLGDRCSNKIIERVRTQGSGREQRSENHSRERNQCFWHSGPRLAPVIVFHRYPTDLQLDARRASQIVMACREGSIKATIDGYLLLRMSRASLPQSGHGTV